MDESIKKWKLEKGSKTLSNISDLTGAEDKKKEVPILWEVKQTEYDSGPKMGID